MKVHFLGAPAPTYLTDKMSASSRVYPQERAVWRFDARGGYPWGVEQIRANLGAFRGDLSLFGDGSPSDQNEHSDKLVTIFGIRITEWTKCPLGYASDQSDILSL